MRKRHRRRRRSREVEIRVYLDRRIYRDNCARRDLEVVQRESSDCRRAVRGSEHLPSPLREDRNIRRPPNFLEAPRGAATCRYVTPR